MIVGGSSWSTLSSFSPRLIRLILLHKQVYLWNSSKIDRTPLCGMIKTAVSKQVEGTQYTPDKPGSHLQNMSNLSYLSGPRELTSQYFLWLHPYKIILFDYKYSIEGSYDSVFGKRVLTYWEILGKYGNSWLQSDGLANSTHGNLYIFGKMRLSSFRKYIVFYAYPKSIHIAVFRSSPFFQVH